MSCVFVSYSRQDKQAVARLAAVLTKDGHQVSMDDAIKPGAFWREKLAEAIQAADTFMIVLSGHSIASEEVRIELELAADERKPIIPVVIEQVRIPGTMKHALAGRNRIDLSSDSAAGHESLRAALAADAAAAPGASFDIHAITARRTPPTVRTTPVAAPKAESKPTADPERSLIEAGQNLITKYDEIIARLDSAMPKSLAAILPGTWQVSIGHLGRWTFALEKSGAFKAESNTMLIRREYRPDSLAGKWAVMAELSVEFTPRLNTIRSMPFDFTFSGIDRKKLVGTTNFPGEPAFLSKEDERSETVWSRA